MKINKGMYVRTKKGIGRVTEYIKHESWGYIVKVLGQYSCYTHTSNGELSDVIKASHNLIDLIEVGDYVNGTFVLDFKTLATGEKAVIVDGLINYGWGQGVTPVSDIKDIVTKEQFNSMKYVVERDK